MVIRSAMQTLRCVGYRIGASGGSANLVPRASNTGLTGSRGSLQMSSARSYGQAMRSQPIPYRRLLDKGPGLQALRGKRDYLTCQVRGPSRSTVRMSFARSSSNILSTLNKRYLEEGPSNSSLRLYNKSVSSTKYLFYRGSQTARLRSGRLRSTLVSRGGEEKNIGEGAWLWPSLSTSFYLPPPSDASDT